MSAPLPDLTAEDVAELLQLSTTVVRRMFRAGTIPGAVRTGPGTRSPVRISVKDFEKYRTTRTPVNR